MQLLPKMHNHSLTDTLFTHHPIFSPTWHIQSNLSLHPRYLLTGLWTLPTLPLLGLLRQSFTFLFCQPVSVSWAWSGSNLIVGKRCTRSFLRFLVQQNTALFSTFRSSSVLRHRRDILTFFDILTVYTMTTIYFLNAYHPRW